MRRFIQQEHISHSSNKNKIGALYLQLTQHAKLTRFRQTTSGPGEFPRDNNVVTREDAKIIHNLYVQLQTNA